jgi:branched-chain amino acid transport system substrate-binding protein
MKSRYLHFLSLAVLLAGCGAGVDETVVIGWSGALTGPTSDVGVYLGQGVEDYCRYANDEHLVPGHRLNCLLRDDQYNNDNTMRNFESFLDAGMVAFLSYATGATLQLKVNAMEERIPVLSASYHVEVIDPPNQEFQFLPISTYSEQLLLLMEWIAENHHANGPPRVAILAHPSPFGRAPVADARKAAELLGMQIVEVQESGPGVDNSAMLQRWAASGVQYVLGQNVQAPIATLLTTAQALGLTDRMKFLGAHYTGGAHLTSLAGAAAEGYIWATSYRLADEDTPGMRLQQEIGKRYGRTEDTYTDVNYTTGMLMTAIHIEAIRRAAEKGEESISSESVYRELLDMNGSRAFDSGFAISPITFSRSDRVGADDIRLIQVQNGAWRPISGALRSRTFPLVHPLN